MRTFFALVLVPCGLLVACGASSESTMDPAGTSSSTSSSGEPTLPAITKDAGVAADASSKTTVGSPLCRRTASDCRPDDDHPSCAPAAPAADAGAEEDAGSAQACRVSRYFNDPPRCEAAGPGKEGTACSTSLECAAGFECVSDDEGLGDHCRRYCCDGTCPLAMGSKYYCGIRNATMGVKVPVCALVKPCVLLAPNTCPMGQTCAIVRDDGATSCIEAGPQAAGEPCDRANCGTGLTCIGTAGAQKCFKLCREGDSGYPACGSNERCVGGAPLFREAGYGVCVAANAVGSMP